MLRRNGSPCGERLRSLQMNVAASGTGVQSRADGSLRGNVEGNTCGPMRHLDDDGIRGDMCLRSITIGSVFEEPSLRAQKQRLDWVPWRAPLRKVIDTAFANFDHEKSRPDIADPSISHGVKAAGEQATTGRGVISSAPLEFRSEKP